MNTDLYEYSHNSMVPMYSKFNDICVRFLVIVKNIFISFINEYRRPILRPPNDVIDDVITVKTNFWHNLGLSFHI